MPNYKQERVELPIRTRRTYDSDGSVEQYETVFCPSRGASLEVGTCLDCHYCFGRTYAGDPGLVCLHPTARHPDRPQRQVRMPSPAELTTLSEIMTCNVSCVGADLDVDAVATLLLEQSISAVPVVDASGKPIGVVSKTDLVRWYHDDRAAEIEPATAGPERGMTTRSIPPFTVADVMMPMAFTLTEEAPVAYAAALMAVEDVHHLPIVSGDGRVVGIVSALDIVRWLANNDGFVVPPAR